MSPEEQQMFDAYIAHRREMYSWTQFWVVMIPTIAVVALYIYIVIRLIMESS